MKKFLMASNLLGCGGMSVIAKWA
ncbi:BnaAnng39900D [Brassica napus]|uniref:BnaAnng39900D protein n=1 Tax=Brassica napus TaxID=3708 RepID=A0A078JZH1_BRANA|nr:BnaAnng39900D [Brassica napus]